MRILLPIDWWDEWKVVKADIVNVAPHLASVATFAIHDHPIKKGYFRISNVETGYTCFKWDSKTKDAAIRKSIAKLAQITPAAMVDAYGTFLKSGKK